jgi:transcription elongation factor Elf1
MGATTRMVRPRSTLWKGIDMRQSTRSRTATPEELADEQARWIRATTKSPAPESQGNLCATLAMFAAWRQCSACGDRVLYVDERAQTGSTFVCGGCLARKESLAEQARRSAHQEANLPNGPGCPSCGSVFIFVDESLAHPRATCSACSRSWPAQPKRQSIPARVAKALRALVMGEVRT